jgi:hypothetical protein
MATTAMILTTEITSPRPTTSSVTTMAPSTSTQASSFHDAVGTGLLHRTVVLLLLLQLLLLLSIIISTVVMAAATASSSPPTYYRIMMGMSLADVIFSLSAFWQPYLIPADAVSLPPWAFGNTQTCSLVGFGLVTFSMVTALCNAYLSLFFLSMVTSKTKQRGR